MSIGDDNLFDELKRTLDLEDSDLDTESEKEDEEVVLDFSNLNVSTKLLERRGNDRYNYNDPVILSDEFSKNHFKFNAMNISRNGICLMATRGKFFLMSKHKITLVDENDETIGTFSGKIVRLINDKETNYQILGISITERSPEAAAFIKSMLK